MAIQHRIRHKNGKTQVVTLTARKAILAHCVECMGFQAHTAASVFPSYRCESCGVIMRGRKRLDPTTAIEDRLAQVM